MNEIITPASALPLLPLPRAAVSVREGTMDDLPFIDSLQKVHRAQVGFMFEGQLQGKIKAREVVVAEDQSGVRVGYCIATDRYFKHDDVGIIYHLNVAPGKQRGFIGATLLKAVFDRAAYGCKLFCCWCAQDIEANKFWESMGFVPLAFRAGSKKKSRVHIFWQKRIRENDTTTPWWFPAKTDAGAMREDRLVLPIPPGKHWSDEMPRIEHAEPKADEARQPARRAKLALTPPPTGAARHGPRQFGGPPAKPVVVPVVALAPKREKKQKVKADPKLVAAVRELKDRWLEHVNANGGLLPAGKYDVTRALPEAPVSNELRRLPDAA